jgi:protease-4
MKKVIFGILAFIGAMAVLAVLVAGLIGLLLSMGEEGVPDVTVVELDLESGLVEYIPDDPLGAAMLSGAVSVREVVEGLTRAAEDDRVVGLVAKVGNGRFGLAQIQEIRDAVEAFRESGKPAIAWAETFGEVSPGNGSYYLATAFDRIYLQPSGDIGLNGLMYESPFIAGALDKLKINAQMDQRHEYKNAMNMYTETGYTEPHREAMQALMDSQFNQMVEGISESRGMASEEVRVLFDQGSFLGEAAMESRLVDGIAYRDEVFALVEEEISQSPEYLYLPVYLERAGRPGGRGKTIGLVYAVGAAALGIVRHGRRFGFRRPALGHRRPACGSDRDAGRFSGRFLCSFRHDLA